MCCLCVRPSYGHPLAPPLTPALTRLSLPLSVCPWVFCQLGDALERRVLTVDLYRHRFCLPTPTASLFGVSIKLHLSPLHRAEPIDTPPAAYPLLTHARPSAQPPHTDSPSHQQSFPGLPASCDGHSSSCVCVNVWVRLPPTAAQPHSPISQTPRLNRTQMSTVACSLHGHLQWENTSQRHGRLQGFKPCELRRAHRSSLFVPCLSLLLLRI